MRCWSQPKRPWADALAWNPRPRTRVEVRKETPWGMGGETVLCISGASGAAYGIRLVEVLVGAGRQVRLVVTASGRLTLRHECGTTPEDLAQTHGVVLDDADDVAARSASGSAKIDAVVICPCSGTTIGKLAAGISDNLVTRSGIVAMKEGRKLILVPRETPLATVHLENLSLIHI